MIGRGRGKGEGRGVSRLQKGKEKERALKLTEEAVRERPVSRSEGGRLAKSVLVVA